LHAQDPFIDGRCYDLICFTCFTIPKTWEYDSKGEIIWYGTKSPDRLSSVADMVSDGWEKQEAEISIRAIKKLLKNPRIRIVPEFGMNIFGSLFFGDSILYPLSD
jgi:hypothetical protein